MNLRAHANRYEWTNGPHGAEMVIFTALSQQAFILMYSEALAELHSRIQEEWANRPGVAQMSKEQAA